MSAICPEGVTVRNRFSVGTVLWIVVGVVVAVPHGYSINNISSLISFLLAMFLWPLVLLGIDLHLNLGA
jgi:hypothetical protein